MGSETVSIIIPIYNCEKYLGRCIDSVLSQTHTELEIILIDDGSTDTSGAICDDYLSRDTRIKVNHSPNRGVSAARNAGIAMSTGEYVTFVDSDDWVEPDYVEYLLWLMKEYKTDIATCGLASDDGNESRVCSQFETKKALLTEILFPQSVYFQGYAAAKLYSRHILSEGDTPILFNEKIAICEDRLFWYESVIKSGCAAISSKPLYHYCVNHLSAMHRIDFDKQYNDFTARRLCLDTVSSIDGLYTSNAVSAVDAAVYCFAVSKKNRRTQKSDAKAFIRRNLKHYKASPEIRRIDKLYAVLICRCEPLYLLLRWIISKTRH